MHCGAWVLIWACVCHGAVGFSEQPSDSCGFFPPEEASLSLSVSGSAWFLAVAHMCDKMQELSEGFLPKTVSMVPFADSNLTDLVQYGRNLNEDRAILYQELLLHKSDELDVLWLDAPWIGLVTDHMLPLNLPDPSKFPPRNLRHNSEGEVISVSGKGNQLVMYYRKDIFDLHGKAWPSDMAEFDSTVREVMMLERQRRDTEDYWGFLIATDDSANRMSYMLATLLSTENAGSVVEDDGRVTIASAAAATVIRRWRSWFGWITPTTCLGMDNSGTRGMFLDDKAAVVILWSGNSGEMNRYNQAKNWSIAAAPVPGEYGAGCSGDWSLGIAKYTKFPELSRAFVSTIAENLHRASVEKDDEEALTISVLKDPELHKQYCKANRVLCDSYAAYPAFWSRMVHRPTAGCGSLYRGCTEAVYRKIHPFLASASMNADETLRSLERDLLALLGNVTVAEVLSDGGAASGARGQTVGGLCVACVILSPTTQWCHIKSQGAWCDLPAANLRI
eukprot:TRINITY_DN4686_c2_g1_i1.p1 TRINITY_DN4686_c2_g1~~TRINITY_DN4686_c2_g1_i1.p1  ORF type:complete len:505 (+),score=130.64 TRINITY_DN4686_c2_g1_i1:379-1893(+)